MSKITMKQFHTPMNSASIRKVVGQIKAAMSSQAAAADGAVAFDRPVATHRGTVTSLYLVMSGPLAADEKMSINVKKNGQSIMVGGVPFEVTSVLYNRKDLYDLTDKIDQSKNFIDYGDLLTVDRDYTAGVGPTAGGGNVVGLEWAPRSDE